MKRKLSILLIAALLLAACESKWAKAERLYRVGLPIAVDRLHNAGKLTIEEATEIKYRNPFIVDAIKTKDFGAVAVHLGALAKLRIKNPEGQQWLTDLLAITSVILGVDIPSGSPDSRMKSVPRQREPNLSDENLKRLESLVK